MNDPQGPDSKPPVHDPIPVFDYLPAPPKFQHGWAVRPIVLFCLTALSTSLTGYGMSGLPGLWYAPTILIILGAHEFGHYFACRWHNVDCTLPYFLPMPFVLTGTLGAVIRIKEPFPSRAALFDIGVAGPIAGFVTLLPFLIFGIMLSDVAPIPEDLDTTLILGLGEPLLLKFLAGLIHGPLPEGTDLMLHPMGFAAWFGMLATALNLLPFGQLDGGHLTYGVIGDRATLISKITLGVVIALTIVTYSWIVMAIMLTLMAWFAGFRHPRPWDDYTPLSRGRLIVAALTVLIFVMCFTPEPIKIEW